jgi:hypothetical protein
MRASKLAQVALNISGMLSGLVRIVLRSSFSWTRIPQVKNQWLKKQRRTIFSSSDLDIHDHMTSPVFLPEKAERMRIIPTDPEKSTTGSPGRFSSWDDSNQHNIYATTPEVSETAHVAPPPRIILTPSASLHRPSYSIFPTHTSTLMRESGSTTFSMGYEEIEPPRPPFVSGHKRGLSEQTSATVEIGFRFSHANPTLYPDQLSPTSTNVPFLFMPRSSSIYSCDHPSDEGGPQLERSWDPPEDIAILPTQPNEPRTPSQISSPICDLLSPGWFHRKGTTAGSKSRRDRNIMKSLPPVPRNVNGSQGMMGSSCTPSKLAS